MNGSAAISTYRSVSNQSAVVDTNPHQLVLMLIDGAIEKTGAALGRLRSGEIAEKGRLIGGSIAIIDGLRVSLDHEAGGELAANLERIYDYMSRRLLEANMRNEPAGLEEVISLLKEIREAWSAIPQEVRGGRCARSDGRQQTLAAQ
ncbi:flagellar biosynthetic protein FliS [Thioflavicoccus mobilis 8321]|uniref:Flagellar secretion chaperone FliS n=1 Tax=Thioflavicoccus mobilis 8321 TaxID=765912 RepID=U3GM62_9GAMM|nr:flagellar export chaperone FliS [Thioflavicoccus mobilis]AGA89132.1 flagellar biosynthetic protein FliS [Thioflavicoccus mobilis 8321]